MSVLVLACSPMVYNSVQGTRCFLISFSISNNSREYVIRVYDEGTYAVYEIRYALFAITESTFVQPKQCKYMKECIRRM